MALHAGGVGGGSASVIGQILASWGFPGDLNTSENSYILRKAFPAAVTIGTLVARVLTAPVGSAITITLKKGTIATGVLGATLGTVVIADGAYSGSGTINAAIATTEFVVIEITAVGSGTPGATASVDALAA